MLPGLLFTPQVEKPGMAGKNGGIGHWILDIRYWKKCEFLAVQLSNIQSLMVFPC
jgi:hypothetical protein